MPVMASLYVLWAKSQAKAVVVRAKVTYYLNHSRV